MSRSYEHQLPFMKKHHPDEIATPLSHALFLTLQANLVTISDDFDHLFLSVTFLAFIGLRLFHSTGFLWVLRGQTNERQL
eukprot:28968-Amphidinium_carterae.1